MSDDDPTICATCFHPWHGSWECGKVVTLPDGTHRKCICSMASSSTKPREQKPMQRAPKFACRQWRR